MSGSEITPRRSHDLDFLKSIINEDGGSNISRIDEVNEEDVPRLSFHTKARETSSHHFHLNNSSGQNKYYTPSPPTSPYQSPGRPDRVRVTVKDVKNQNNEDAQHQGESGTEQEHSTDSKPRRRGRRRPHSAHPPTGGGGVKEQWVVDPNIKDIAAYRLEQKYLQLRELLQGAGQDKSNKRIKAVSRMAYKYHMEALGMSPGHQNGGFNYSPRSSAVMEQLGLDGLQRSTSSKQNALYSPRSDSGQESYILIDGTGPRVMTRRVMLSPPGDREEHPSSAAPPVPAHRTADHRSRPVGRRPPSGKRKAWDKTRTNSEVSTTQKTKINKQRSRSTSSVTKNRSASDSSSRSRSSSRGKKTDSKSDKYYSDSFDSDSSSSSSRSRSRTRTRTVDLHLKYTKNDKLLAWLKDKDKMYHEQKKKERKEKREKRKQNKLKAEEKEKIREKSEAAVEEWMKKKSSEQRLLKRKQKRNPQIAEKNEDFVVIDETLDLKEYGARINPDDVPKVLPKDQNDNKEEEKGEKNDTRARGRQKPSLMSHSRPPSKQKSRFTQGAKEKAQQLKDKILQEQELEEKRRKSYNDWLKSKSKAGKKEKEKPADDGNQEKITNDKTQGELKAQDKDVKIPGTEDGEENEDKSARIDEDTKDKDIKDNDAKKKVDEKSTKAKRRPQSAKPSKKPVAAAVPSPPEAGQVDVQQPQDSDEPPRTKTPSTKAYRAVKHEQKSWEKFGDFVWTESNRVVEEEEKEKAGDDQDVEEKEDKKVEEKTDNDGEGIDKKEEKAQTEVLSTTDPPPPPSDSKEAMADWGEEETVSKKVMNSAGENEVGPPLWLTNDDPKKEETTTEQNQRTPGSSEVKDPGDEGKEESHEESPSSVDKEKEEYDDDKESFPEPPGATADNLQTMTGPSGEVLNSGTFLTALE